MLICHRQLGELGIDLPLAECVTDQLDHFSDQLDPVQAELLALAVLAAVLDHLDPGARRRALTYLGDRFGLPGEMDGLLAPATAESPPT